MGSACRAPRSSPPGVERRWACRDAAGDLAGTIENLFASGDVVPMELGGPDGTTSYVNKVLTKLG